jgi:hypothetical protein
VDYAALELQIVEDDVNWNTLAYINRYSENKLNHFLWNKKTLLCYFYVLVKNHPNCVFLYWKFLKIILFHNKIRHDCIPNNNTKLRLINKKITRLITKMKMKIISIKKKLKGRCKTIITPFNAGTSNNIFVSGTWKCHHTLVLDPVGKTLVPAMHKLFHIIFRRFKCNSCRGQFYYERHSFR